MSSSGSSGTRTSRHLPTTRAPCSTPSRISSRAAPRRPAIAAVRSSIMRTSFADPSHPGHRVVEANRREWRRRLAAIAEALGAPKPKLLADGLLLLVEGAYTASQTLGGPKGPGAALTSVAKAMVDGHM